MPAREVRHVVRVASPGRRRPETTLVRLHRARTVLEHRGALHADGPPPGRRRRARRGTPGGRVRTAFGENETTVQKLKVYSQIIGAL